MGPNSRPDHMINHNYLPQTGSSQPCSVPSTESTSPVEPVSGNMPRYSIGNGNNLANVNNSNGNSRLGTASPSHEFGGGRLYSKRAREIQAQEGVGPQVWGPPTSGNSTPLRETIPESPNSESFPEFGSSGVDTSGSTKTTKRNRAGTLPSRFSPAGQVPGMTSALHPKTSHPTPSTSPFEPASNPAEALGFQLNTPNATKSILLSRLRAGTMPHAFGLVPGSGPFGPSLFSTNWASGRDRSSTLASIRSSEGPVSPAQSSFSRDSLADTGAKTLDYLGLADTPQQSREIIAPSSIELPSENNRQQIGLQHNSMQVSANRCRSYSVNAKDSYSDYEYDTGYASQNANNYNNIMSASDGSSINYEEIQERIRRHNQEVQLFEKLANASRPRARTASVLDAPSTRLIRMPASSRLDSSLEASNLPQEIEYNQLSEAVHGLQLLNGTPAPENSDEANLEGPTRALWLGNIPSSTTVSSLNMIFSQYGPIESTRVLTHKNCGFVNFEQTQSAKQAMSELNGTEIFPGAGPVRVNYAKVPSTSVTPNNNMYFSSTPDPMSKDQGDTGQNSVNGIMNPGATNENSMENTFASPKTPALFDIREDVVQIVKELGANDEQQKRIMKQVDKAISFNKYESEVPPISEPSHNRMYDAPRLREIRKRIDNNCCSQSEIEDVALGMLPEIAELSSDYLGNTVVQKLFEYCSEDTKKSMLAEIAPHLAKIGIHKNGTWAAQKIIDVARTPTLMQMVVDALRPYGVSLFLDQFGNYVMQGCLRYGVPLNDFIFEVMICHLWDLAQGRFGARAMRACLESHYASKDQQRMVAAAIALHSVQLATNANGALLLTWFLDTCTFPCRRTVLAPRLVPHLVQLCTHKVAYLTVLKIINQRNEPEARDTILKELFLSPKEKVLEDILADQSCGATLIFKVLTTPFFNENMRSEALQNVRNVLIRIKAQSNQGYKRLMDEVGLSTRNGGSNGGRDVNTPRDLGDNSRPGSKHSVAPNDNQVHSYQQQQQQQRSHQGGVDGGHQAFFPTIQPHSFDTITMMPRPTGMDSQGFEQYPSMNGINASPGFLPVGATPPPGVPVASMTPQQVQYQQALLASSARHGQFYPTMMNPNGYSNPVLRGILLHNIPHLG